MASSAAVAMRMAVVMVMVVVAMLMMLGSVSAMGVNAARAATTTAPLLMTSNTELFHSGHTGDLAAPVDAFDVTRLFRALSGKGSSSYVQASASTPELIVVFVYPELSLTSLVEESAHFAYAKEELETARSSIVLPMVSGSATIATLSKQFGRVYSFSAATTSEADLKTALDTLSSNGHPDLLLISVTLETPAELLQSLVRHARASASAAAAASSAAYFSSSSAVVFGVFGASSGRTLELSFEASSSDAADSDATFTPMHTFSTMASNAGQTYCNVTCVANKTMPSMPPFITCNGTRVFPGPQYVTPNIIVGAAIVIFNLFILYIALGCLMSIQRPVRMSTAPLVLSKEY